MGKLLGRLRIIRVSGVRIKDTFGFRISSFSAILVPMRQRFDDKGPNLLFLGAAVIVLFGMIWLSCHQNEFIRAFTPPSAPSAAPASPAP